MMYPSRGDAIGVLGVNEQLGSIGRGTTATTTATAASTIATTTTTTTATATTAAAAVAAVETDICDGQRFIARSLLYWSTLFSFQSLLF